MFRGTDDFRNLYEESTAASWIMKASDDTSRRDSLFPFQIQVWKEFSFRQLTELHTVGVLHNLIFSTLNCIYRRNQVQLLYSSCNL